MYPHRPREEYNPATLLGRPSLRRRPSDRENHRGSTYDVGQLADHRGPVGRLLRRVIAGGGTVTDTLDDGVRLFTRAILPAVREVRPGDGLRGGVAVRATGDDLRVHPYVFRLVCKNGAISARATQSWRIERDDLAADPDRSAADVLAEFREQCGLVPRTRPSRPPPTGCGSATLAEADQFLNLLPVLSSVLHHLPAKQANQIVQQILGRFDRDGDRSRLG